MEPLGERGGLSVENNEESDVESRNLQGGSSRLCWLRTDS
jgi:hypothetical protein